MNKIKSVESSSLNRGTFISKIQKVFESSKENYKKYKENLEGCKEEKKGKNIDIII